MIVLDSKTFLFNSDELLDQIAHITHGFVGADLLNLYRHVFMNRKEDMIGLSAFKNALQIIKPAGAAEFSAKVYYGCFFDYKDSRYNIF